MFADPVSIQGRRSSVRPRMKLSQYCVVNPSMKPAFGVESHFSSTQEKKKKKTITKAFNSTVVEEEIEKSFVEQSTFHLKNRGKIK